MTAAKAKRGFAAMDPELARRISSMGGRAAHRKGTAYHWDSEKARVAGRKGGQNSKVINARRRHDMAIAMARLGL